MGSQSMERGHEREWHFLYVVFSFLPPADHSNALNYCTPQTPIHYTFVILAGAHASRALPALARRLVLPYRFLA